MTHHAAVIVDSHCHLDFPDFDGKLTETLAFAEENGVRYMQTICTRVSQFDRIYAVADASPRIWCSVGQHPNNVEQDPFVTKEELLRRCALPKTIGIGETGLDYYYEKASRDLQRASFRTHIAASRETGLPLIVHTRDAEEDTLRLLREEMDKGAFPFLIHCFSAGENFASACLELGGYISLSGVVTFKNAEELRRVAAGVPISRLLAETDSPYLAPVPHRGKTNAPAYASHVVAKIAEIKNLSFADAANATTENFFRLFAKAAKKE
ncbi:MAG: TatD family hydrolase [Rickettsiales bacterium]